MTNLPFNGIFKCTCVYRKKGSWAAGFHTGIDLVGTNKDVYSVSNGKVIMAKTYGDYGNAVKVKDENGNIFLYAHLKSISVRIGQTVTRVSKIGVMGSTGNSTGPHLHLEMRTSADKYGVVKDIANYIGIPNQLGTYNSADYQLNDNKYNVGDYVETNVDVFFTGSEQDEKILVDTKQFGTPDDQFFIHNSLVKNNKIKERCLVVWTEGDRCLLEVFDTQFWCKNENIVKKL